MRFLLPLLICLLATSGFGQIVNFRNLTSSQFSSNNFVLSIKANVPLTNPVVASGSLRGLVGLATNSSGVTIDDLTGPTNGTTAGTVTQIVNAVAIEKNAGLGTNNSLMDLSYRGNLLSTNAYPVIRGVVSDAIGTGGQILLHHYPGDTNAGPFSVFSTVATNAWTSGASPFRSLNDVQLFITYNHPSMPGYKSNLPTWVRGFESTYFPGDGSEPQMEIYDRVTLTNGVLSGTDVGSAYTVGLVSGAVTATVGANSTGFRSQFGNPTPWMTITSDSNNVGIVTLKGQLNFINSTNDWLIMDDGNQGLIGTRGSNYLFSDNLPITLWKDAAPNASDLKLRFGGSAIALNWRANGTNSLDVHFEHGNDAVGWLRLNQFPTGIEIGPVGVGANFYAYRSASDGRLYFRGMQAGASGIVFDAAGRTNTLIILESGDVGIKQTGYADSFFATNSVTVADLAYNATTWNGSTAVPTRNAVRDALEALSTGAITGMRSNQFTTNVVGQAIVGPVAFGDSVTVLADQNLKVGNFSLTANAAGDGLEFQELSGPSQILAYNHLDNTWSFQENVFVGEQLTVQGGQDGFGLYVVADSNYVAGITRFQSNVVVGGTAGVGITNTSTGNTTNSGHIRASGFSSTGAATIGGDLTAASLTTEGNLNSGGATISGELSAEVLTGLGSGVTNVASGDSATAFFSTGSIEDARIPDNITIDLATVASTVTVLDSTDATSFVAIFESATGSLAAKTDGALLYNATSGALSATSFAGAGGGLTLDSSGFNGNLATSDNTLQEVAQKVDDLSLGGGSNPGIIYHAGTQVMTSNSVVITNLNASTASFQTLNATSFYPTNLYTGQTNEVLLTDGNGKLTSDAGLNYNVTTDALTVASNITANLSGLNVTLQGYPFLETTYAGLWVSETPDSYNFVFVGNSDGDTFFGASNKLTFAVGGIHRVNAKADSLELAVALYPTNGVYSRSNTLFYFPTNAPTAGQILTASDATGVTRWSTGGGSVLSPIQDSGATDRFSFVDNSATLVFDENGGTAFSANAAAGETTMQPPSGGARINLTPTQAQIVSADLTMSTGNFISLASGANQRAGNATLVGGTVTVNNTTVTANTIVMLSRKTAGGTLGSTTYTLSAGTSFTINSSSGSDTSVVSYLLIEVP